MNKINRNINVQIQSSQQTLEINTIHRITMNEIRQEINETKPESREKKNTATKRIE